MAKYLHTYRFFFTVKSDDPEATDVTPEMMVASLLREIRKNNTPESLSAACTGPVSSSLVGDP